MRLNLGLKYIFSTAFLLLIVMGITLSIIAKRHEALVIEQTKIQAKALFQQIVITRRWVADHGAIFVEKLPWLEPNPYLKDPLMIDRQGRHFVKENPAMVTKQLSQYAQKDRLYSFHITSLKLMNPENAPDDFEKNALLEFEQKKVSEASRVEKVNGSSFFRYIAPLYVEQACLECHLKQGYKINDVRGAISITVPMDYAFSVIATDRRYLLMGGFATVAALMIFLHLITRNMVIRPISRIMAGMADFSKNEKPEISPIETGDEIEDLSRSFVEMATAINDYHGCLQEKIRLATQELVEKNETLLRLNRSKSDSIAKISHELRTPLTAIKGAMDYLSVKLSMQERDSNDDTVFFDVIKKNADRLIRLVNNVLDYERIGLGAFEMHFTEFPLKEVFNEVIIGFRSEAEKKGISLMLDADDVIVTADEDRMKQVLINLISNALNFSPESSKIEVSLKEAEGYALVTVTDFGSGIPEADKELIFNQFYSKGNKNGTGLGLAICKGIVNAHHGEIGVLSTEGKGSSFYIRIPIKQRESNGQKSETACSR